MKKLLFLFTCLMLTACSTGGNINQAVEQTLSAATTMTAQVNANSNVETRVAGTVAFQQQQTEEAKNQQQLLETQVAATILAAEQATQSQAQTLTAAVPSPTFTPEWTNTPEHTSTPVPPTSTPTPSPTIYASPTGVQSSGDACNEENCHKITFKNKTEQDATINLDGPGSYFYTIPPGTWVFEVVPGRYHMVLDIPACDEHIDFYHALNAKWYYDIKCDD